MDIIVINVKICKIKFILSAFNFSDEELRKDVIFNKMTSNESPSAYYFNDNSITEPMSFESDKQTIVEINKRSAKAKIGNFIFPKQKNTTEYYWKTMANKENDQHYVTGNIYL